MSAQGKIPFEKALELCGKKIVELKMAE